VYLTVEIFRNDAFQHPVYGVIVNENTAQDGHFCIEILGGEFWVSHLGNSLYLKNKNRKDWNTKQL
jgi:hypothetical protein